MNTTQSYSVAYLKERLNQEFGELAMSPNLEKIMQKGFVDKRLYAIYLVETYHYTRHNSRNQALVATRPENLDVRYMKFCLRHAEEEAGHEMMALHDIRHLGYNVNESALQNLQPLEATQSLIDYLYKVASHGNPLARMGYSFWAEQSYDYIQPIIHLISSAAKVPDRAMTFLKEHAAIDEAHARQVTEAIERFVIRPEDWKSVEECMIQSLLFTARMMDEVLEEFVKVKEGRGNRYAFLETAEASQQTQDTP